MNQLLLFYKSVLQSLDCIILPTGEIRYKTAKDEDPTPVTVLIRGKRMALVLPTDEALTNTDWLKSAVFHPGAESVICGQSEVMGVLTTLLSVKVHETIQLLVGSIIQLGNNHDAYEKLTLRQRQLIDSFPITKSVEQLAISIAKKNTGFTGANPLISIRLTRGGEINDEMFSRTCILVAHILKDRDTFCGVTKGSAKDKETMRAIYEYVIPPNRVGGSNSINTPYFLAMLDCFYKLFLHFNRITEVLDKYTPLHPLVMDWHDMLPELPKLIKTYLPQPYPGNIGNRLTNGIENELPEDIANVASDETVKVGTENLSEYTATGLKRLTPLNRPQQQQPQQLVVPQQPVYSAPLPVQYQLPPQPQMQVQTSLTTAQALAQEIALQRQLGARSVPQNSASYPAMHSWPGTQTTQQQYSVQQNVVPGNKYF